MRLSVGLLAAILLLSACAQSVSEQQEGSKESGSQQKNTGWIDAVLHDVNTNSDFTIAGLVDGEPVLVESFAVWCPTCTKQQQEIQKLHKKINFVSVSLDTDPNEDEAIILDHAQRQGFSWFYAVSPAEVTKDLIREFGPGIVNAPSAPVILICPDSSIHKLGGGLKLEDELLSEINTRCNQ